MFRPSARWGLSRPTSPSPGSFFGSPHPCGIQLLGDLEQILCLITFKDGFAASWTSPFKRNGIQHVLIEAGHSVDQLLDPALKRTALRYVSLCFSVLVHCSFSFLILAVGSPKQCPSGPTDVI